ncbi:hypothetical protein GYMLUDRAFT_246508 [Collybiopsis luxurians FD-317 M1]|uniref:Uncharacterized protein n=1 Tax=Collybiopsis luxurians FD-317 M1 TaxID=944289 RepID=A0A0D0CHT9_9AGAR|nr:hypothetical protein GYMLUDRAFT_246508 [Collybiopsis luxurians FD-317 M1]
MLKAGGWIISRKAALDWFEKHAGTVNLAELPHSPHIRSHILTFWDIRNEANCPPPFKRHQVTYFMYPKLTPENWGDSVCFLVSRLYRSSTDTWNNYKGLDMREQDHALFERVTHDGLALGEWITIADPWEDDWPFYKRHPGKRCPPDPDVEAIETRVREKREEAVRLGLPAPNIGL